MHGIHPWDDNLQVHIYLQTNHPLFSLQQESREINAHQRVVS